VFELQTVAMQSVITDIASTGAFKHAHWFVTSTQLDGSARPMGMRQFHTQCDCDCTAGSAVMVYSAADTLAKDDGVAAGMAIDDTVIDVLMGVEVAARAPLRTDVRSNWRYFIISARRRSFTKG